MKTVQEVGLMLMNLPMDSARQVGQYYQALAFKRNGKKDEAQASLELVAEDAPLTYRARALQTLGTIYHGQGQLDDALRLYLEAARAAQYKNRPNLITYLMAHFQVSFIKSDIGDHRGALTHLENLLPLVMHTAKQSPFCFYVYHSDLAFELAQLGRLTEAEAASAIALASPFAPAYPEWTETRNEIAAKHRSASRSTVAINRTPEADPPQQIERERKRQRVSALASSWSVSKEDSVQRCNIAIGAAFGA
jgi:tetratricopeptide (TPR) repeat protein